MDSTKSQVRAEIGARIASFRKESGLKQAEFSRQLGISTASLSRIEAGEAGLSADRLLEIAKLLRVSVAEILGDSSEASSVTREEAGVLALYHQLDDDYKNVIVNLMRLHIRQTEAERQAGLKGGRHGTI